VPFWSSVVPLSPWRTPHTYELIGIALRFGNEVCHDAKHCLAVPRPSELSPRVQPILQTPGWAALPSGHATEAYLFAALMLRLLGQPIDPAGNQLAQTLLRQAGSIADNRVHAGLHFPMDSISGRVLGETLAAYVHARCQPRSWQAMIFDGNDDEMGDADLDPTKPLDDLPGCAAGIAGTARQSGILSEMWGRARSELVGLGF